RVPQSLHTTGKTRQSSQQPPKGGKWTEGILGDTQHPSSPNAARDAKKGLGRITKQTTHQQNNHSNYHQYKTNNLRFPAIHSTPNQKHCDT
ncbi:MAG: hypothetical protein V1708_04505, partial [Candidatus Micrarchaeota archaeon]